jgi:serine phosphatase RsbU (regulator of sigma subunit)
VRIGRGAVVKILGTVSLAGLAVALSVALKQFLGVPNYGLGVVMGVTLACYLYGPGLAVACLAIAIVGLYLGAVEPASRPFPVASQGWARILTILFTSALTCGLVVLLRSARDQIEHRNLELRKAQAKLGEALHYEHQVASTLQKAFLPALPSRIGNISIAAVYEPGSAEAEIGGDFYDIFEIAPGRLSVALGDVSGKGIHAARQAVTAKYGLRAYAPEDLSPAACLSRLNDMLFRDPDFAGFVTLFHGILDTSTGALTYCTGGHEPPILSSLGSSETVELGRNGMLLAATPDGRFGEESVTLRKGDTVLIFSDGLSESRSAEGMLGTRGLADILVMALRSDSGPDVQACLTKVVESARDFAGGTFRDDVAALLVRFG